MGGIHCENLNLPLYHAICTLCYCYHHEGLSEDSHSHAYEAGAFPSAGYAAWLECEHKHSRDRSADRGGTNAQHIKHDIRLEAESRGAVQRHQERMARCLALTFERRLAQTPTRMSVGVRDSLGDWGPPSSDPASQAVGLTSNAHGQQSMTMTARERRNHARSTC